MTGQTVRPLATLNQAAAHLGVSRRTVRHLATSGAFPMYRLPGRWWFQRYLRVNLDKVTPRGQ